MKKILKKILGLVITLVVVFAIGIFGLLMYRVGTMGVSVRTSHDFTLVEMKDFLLGNRTMTDIVLQDSNAQELLEKAQKGEPIVPEISKPSKTFDGEIELDFEKVTSVSKKEVKKLANRDLKKFGKCYDNKKFVLANFVLQVRVAKGSGKVEAAIVRDYSTGKDEEIEACILEVVKDWTFKPNRKKTGTIKIRFWVEA